MFILNRNQCSFWTGIGVQIGPEYATEAAIVGMRFRPDVTEEDIANLSHSHIVLEREPGNPHDHNAVKCVVSGKHIGYINKETAELASVLLAEGATYKVFFENRYKQSVAVTLKFEKKERGKTVPPKRKPEPAAIIKNPTPEPKKSKTPIQRNPSPRPTATSENDDRCFIASYAFGIDDPRTDYFREFRDRHLLHSLAGRLLMRAYYVLSPYLVLMCRQNSLIDVAIRSALKSLLPDSYRNL